MKKIVCLGDSITDAERLFSSNGLGQGYVRELNTMIQGRNSQEYELVNRGVNGFTVARLLENVRRDCINRSPNLTTILIGVNDVGLMMNTDRTLDQQEKMLQEFVKHYYQLLEEIQRYTDSRLILMEPFIFPRPQEYVNWIPWIKRMSKRIEDLAVELSCPYVFLHDRLNEAANQYGFDSITTDGIHLTAAGHEIIAKTLFREIQRGDQLSFTYQF